MKEELWVAARASTVPKFEKAMVNMKILNEEAWRDNMAIPAKMWSWAVFNTYPLCNLQVNNMCEAFNREILEYRNKLIIN